MLKISILIPVYNVEKYIEKCLDTIIHQTYPEIEIILGDDGSTDRSGIICDEYASRDTRIKVIHKENEGLLLTRRKLFAMATGDYVWCVDSDDWVALDAVRIFVECIQRTNADIVICGYDFRKEEDSPLERIYSYTTKVTIFENNERNIVYQDLVLIGKLDYIWQKMIRKELISIEDESNPLYATHKIGEDILQLLPIFTRARKIVSIPDSLYHYRLSTSGMTRNFTANYISDKMNLMMEKEKFLDENQLFDPEIRLKLYRSVHFHLIKNVYALVHCNKYSKKEIIKCMSYLSEHEVFQKVCEYKEITSQSKADGFVEYMIRKKHYSLLISILRTEQMILHWVRRKMK